MLVPTIGIEVHCELKSKTKVYSKSANEFSVEANKNITLIDYGYPGSLPSLNKEVIDKALLACLALNCKINKVMHWDRKNYFYPDLPKGYQITQQETPIGYDGYVEIEVNGKKKKIRIERIHIEEDTCKSIHENSDTKLNFNRAGVPLIEIVTRPDIENGEEAMAYVEALRLILLYIGITDAKIEEGSMRCDTNVSLKEKDSNVLGTKVEVKNIGSISNVMHSINYEVKRQKEILESGGKIVEQTRRFNDNTGETVLMRLKETGNDYRYFPEPDIPFVELSDEFIEEVRNKLPVLPTVLKDKYKQANLTDISIKTLLNNKELCDFFEQIYNKTDNVLVSNLLTGEVTSYLNKQKIKLSNTNLTINSLLNLIDFIKSDKISLKQGKDVLDTLLKDGGVVEDIIKVSGMEQISDETVLISIVSEVLKDNPESIKDYKEGKDRAVKYLMGQIMKASRGQANPALVNKILLSELGKY